ncbi:MAG: hypothetical protein ACOCRB_02560 [Halanaerobiaceae bacterium]
MSSICSSRTQILIGPAGILVGREIDQSAESLSDLLFLNRLMNQEMT